MDSIRVFEDSDQPVWETRGMPVPAAEIDHVNRLLSRGRYGRAERGCARLLAEDPSNLRLRSMQASISASRGHITFERAEAILRGLAAEEPGNSRWPAHAAYLMFRQGRVEEGIAELRTLATEYPSDAYVHQVLAGLLHLKQETKPEAWEHYKISVRAQPLSNTCYKSVAYKLALNFEPPLAPQVLAGASTVERAVIRTRAYGAVLLFRIFLTLGLLAFALGLLRQTTSGVVALTAAAAFGAWMIYVNDFACCKKCRNLWVGLLALLLLAVAPTLI